MEFEKPKTDHLVLKPKVVDPTDKPAGAGDGSRISVQKIHAENVLAEALRKKGKRGNLKAPTGDTYGQPPLPKGFKLNEFEVFNDVARPQDEDAVSVDEILLENRVAEDRSGWGRILDWRRRKSRRGRDLIIVVGTFDLTVALFIKFSPGATSVIYGVAAITLFTSMVSWIMLFVVDPY
jgi:hypothetical protein